MLPCLVITLFERKSCLNKKKSPYIKIYFLLRNFYLIHQIGFFLSLDFWQFIGQVRAFFFSDFLIIMKVFSLKFFFDCKRNLKILMRARFGKLIFCQNNEEYFLRMNNVNCPPSAPPNQLWLFEFFPPKNERNYSTQMEIQKKTMKLIISPFWLFYRHGYIKQMNWNTFKMTKKIQILFI